MPLAGSKVTCGLMSITASGSTVNRQMLSNGGRMIVASIKANVLPTQIRCPPPNG